MKSAPIAWVFAMFLWVSLVILTPKDQLLETSTIQILDNKAKMCIFQDQTYCTCCKKRMYEFTSNEYPVQTPCLCNFATINILSYDNCVSCKEECNDEICEPGDIPVKIYYMPNLNKCYMFFEYDDDFCINYSYFYTRAPYPAFAN